MPVAILLLAASYFSYTTLICIGVFIGALKLYAVSCKGKLVLDYDQTNELFKKFVEKSQITSLEYEHFFLSPTPAWQGFIYLLIEIFYENLFPTKFERELFKLKDGGTIGLDWDGGIPDPKVPPTKPILIIAPGLGGGS